MQSTQQKWFDWCLAMFSTLTLRELLKVHGTGSWENFCTEHLKYKLYTNPDTDL